MRRMVLAVAAALALGSPLAAQEDKADSILRDMRKALGGDKLAAAKALTLEGPFQREMGPQRQMKGTIAISIALPDKMYRSEELELPGGMSIERISATNGTVAWEDQKQRGGMGGGMQVMLAGPGGRELNPEAIETARLRRLKTELSRYLVAMFGGANLSAHWVATAEAPGGKADVIELKNDLGVALRLFVDQETHMPLMMQYQEVRPRMMLAGGPGGRGGPGGGRGVGPGAGLGGGRGDGQGPNPQEMRRRMEAMPPSAPSQVTLYLADYKPVDGVMLPHRLTQSVDGAPVEEWTLETIKVNPQIKSDFFDKK